MAESDGRSPKAFPARVLPQFVTGSLLIALVIATTAIGAVAASLILLAGVVPVLFFSYLAEVDRWSDQGVLPLVGAFGFGGVVGLAWAWAVGHWQLQTLAAGVAYVLLPVCVSLLGAVVVHRSGRFDEVLDGYAFTAAITFGCYAVFLVAITAPLLLSGALDTTNAGALLAAMVPTGVLVPVMISASAGTLASSIWAAREPGPSIVPRKWGIVAGSLILVELLSATIGIEGGKLVVVQAVIAIVALLVARSAMRPLLQFTGETVGGDGPA